MNLCLLSGDAGKSVERIIKRNMKLLLYILTGFWTTLSVILPENVLIMYVLD